jgi:hypothetical protein
MGLPGSAPGSRRRIMRSVDSALFAGSWKRAMPALLHAIAQKPPAVSKMR